MRVLVLVPVVSRTRTGLPGRADRTPSMHSPEDRLAEAKGLAEAIDLDVRSALLVPVPQPNPATLFGSGKVEEIRALIEDLEVGLVIVDHAISPGQQRNLEVAWKAKVLDRTGLILEIFGRRAQTREGRLQVELAHLSYQKGRLVRAWTHLERQRGGRGFLGGPGEAQIELDRRMLDERIIAIKRELEGVVRTRDLHRKGRRKVPYPIVAIVGYTNAGKSTLFNRVAGAGVLAMDQVFATLDPTMREVRLPSGRRVILSDTVGFISDLPTQLVAAFRATLEEVIEADLVLHVRDIAHAETEAQAKDVEGVLRDLGVDTVAADGHILEVWNKIDLLAPEVRADAEGAARFRKPEPVLMSAVTGEGVAALLDRIDLRLGVADQILGFTLPAHEGRLLAWLHQNADVLDQNADEAGSIAVRVRIASEKKMRLEQELRRAGLPLPE
ncbi:MAG: GTPase HflX [Hyphomicrobium sp.]|jgi:GTP-binding protein HflX|uniref:GTPase HflX n=1 Tax=Hyphomicrobium sp. TaxID=82 RepID=UPI0025BBBA4D|nr:GTPase HflX [Hyphomicrobium sp.]MBX9861279.1 GTPase HflX [Hyphomicrobium sp.]